jgi:hypothetical protein
VTVVATLVLGIGANSAVFSAIYAVLLRALPFPLSEQLVTLAQSNPGITGCGARMHGRDRDCGGIHACVVGYVIRSFSHRSGNAHQRGDDSSGGFGAGGAVAGNSRDGVEPMQMLRAD